MRPLFAFLSALAACLAIVAPTDAQAPSGSATLTGHAFRTVGASGGDRLFILPGNAAPAGCRPAVGAAVTAVGGGVSASATTSAGGVFSLSMPGGSAVLQATLPGVASVSTALTVPAGGSLSVAAGEPSGSIFTVTSAVPQSPSSVDVFFSGPVAKVTAAAFNIRPPLAVLGATVNAAGCVRLSTASQTGGTTYVVTAANLSSGDGRILDPAHASAPFAGMGTAPQVVDAVAVDPMHVDIRFSVPVLAGSAANAASYSFSPYLQVLSAAVLDDGRRVRVITSEQTAGTLYTARAYGVRDATGAQLSYGAGAPFMGMGQGPRVLSAQAVDDTHVDVRFDEAVDPSTASQLGNYVIPGLQVLGAWIPGDGRVVRLTTTEGREGATCRVLAGGVRDQAGNLMGATASAADFTSRGTPPSVTGIYAVDSTHLDLCFYEALDPASLRDLGAQFAPPLVKGEASLRADGRTVRLAVSEMQSGTPYNATVTGVRDCAGNAVAAAGSPGSFSGIGVAPRLLSAWAVDVTHVDVRYSERVQSAGSYSISPFINVAEAVVLTDGVTVRLTTSEMASGANYTLYASGVTDPAGNPLDTSTLSTTFSGAGGAPRVVSASAVDSVTVEVVFSEDVLPTGAQTTGNYSFSPSLALSFIQLQGDRRTVRLTTSEQRAGQTYQVTCSNIQDTAGNVIGGANCRAGFPGVGVAPQVVAAVAADSIHVDVSFSEALDPSTAGAYGNYTLSPSLQILAAALQPDGLTVRLTTAEQKNGASYTVTAAGVQDAVGNPVGTTGNTAGFTGIGVSPAVSSATATSSTQVQVVLSEPVTSATAVPIGNYAFTPTLSIASAQLQPGNTTVLLTTAEQRDGTSYTVTLSGVKDVAGNPVASPTNKATFTGVGVAPRVLSAAAVDAVTVDVKFDEPLDPTSAVATGNYTVSPTLGVTAATLKADNVTVRLTTAWQFITPYTVTVAGVTDIAGNAVDAGANSAPFGGLSPLTLSGSQVTQVGGNAGSNLGVYRYRATYAHIGGTPPQSVTLTIKRPDTSVMGTFQMAKVNAGDSNFIGGVTYEWRSSVLTGGPGEYSFQVDGTDGSYAAAPLSGTGPTVTALDASRMTFMSTRDGNNEIYVMGADGSAPARITSNAVGDLDPAWSPDGSRVAFNSAPGGSDAILAMDADGSNCTQLTNVASGERNPTWSPDGSRIAFRSARDGNNEIYVMNADGSGQTRITNNAADDIEPAWSSNGRIAFRSNRDGNWEIYTMGGDGSGQTRLTTNAADEMNPAWSPDGSKIAFMSSRDGNNEIYVMDANGGAQTNLTNSAAGGEWNPSWSPDGSKIAFHSDSDSRIYVINTDGSGRTPVTAAGANSYDPEWSAGPQTPSPYSATATSSRQLLMADGASQATVTVSVRDGGYKPLAGATVTFATDLGSISPSDTTDASGLATATLTAGTVAGTATVTATVAGGKNPTAPVKLQLVQGRIAFVTNGAGNNEIYVMNADGTGAANITNNASTEGNMVFSPDGRRMAFGTNRDTSNHLYVMGADGGSPTQLTNNNDDSMAAWAPNASKIAFNSFVDNNQEIYVMDADGSNQTRLTHDTTADEYPTWSPDGNRIAFQTQRDGNYDIYAMNADGSNPAALTTDASDDRCPAWSPDGSRIVFESHRDGNWQIYVMNADGSDQTNVSNSANDDRAARWSPDGKYLVFQSLRDGNSDIYLMRADGSGQTRITNSASSEQTPAWGPAPQAPTTFSVSVRPERQALMAGSPMTVAVCVRDGSYQPRGNVAVALTATNSVVASSATTDANGVAAAALTGGSAGELATVTATAEGKSGAAAINVVPIGQLAFQRTKSDTGTVCTYAAASDGAAAHDVMGNNGAGGSSGRPAWSPDGRRVAFRVNGLRISDRDGSGYTEVSLPSNMCCMEEPAWSPDGTQIAYVAWSNAIGGQIWVTDPLGSNHRVLVSQGNCEEPAWSPDGSKIAFRQAGDGTDYLWVADSGGVDCNLTQLTTSGSDASPSWSPDGTRIAFVSRRDGGNGEIYLMNANGSGQTRLTTTTDAGAEVGNPSWSPDGTMIAYSLSGQRIWAVTADGTRQFPLVATPEGYTDDTPVWGPQAEASSPYSAVVNGTYPVLMAGGTHSKDLSITVRDGSYQPVVEGTPVTISINSTPSTIQTNSTSMATVSLAPPALPGFTQVTVSVTDAKGRTHANRVDCPVVPAGRLAFSLEGTTSDIWTADSDYSGAQATADSGNADVQPRWSPDGRRLAFTISGDGKSGALTTEPIHPEGGGLTPSTPFGGFGAAWAPDGTRFVGTNAGDGHLYSYGLDDDTSPKQLTDGYGERNPAWSADGTRIAYEALLSGDGSVGSYIAVMSADGTNPQPLVGNTGGGGVCAPPQVVGARTAVNGMASIPPYCAQPAWSPDGTKIAFAAGSASSKGIYVVDVATPTNMVPLTTDAASDSPTWSPDGEWLAFHSYRDGQDSLWVLQVSDPSRQFRLGGGKDPQWTALPQEPSPYSVTLVTDKPFLQAGGAAASVVATVRDGSYWPLAGASVAFSAPSGSFSASSDPTAADGTKTASYTPGSTLGAMALTASVSAGKSPNASVTVDVLAGKLAFISGATGSGDVVVMDAAGGTELNRTNSTSANECWPAWTPDGRRILFSIPSTTATDLYAVNPVSGAALPYSERPAETTQAHVRVSPDGTRIAYESDEDEVGNRDVYVADADGSNAKRLTRFAGPDSNPCWSSDGKRIVWERELPTGSEIFTIGADGKGETRLTFNTVPDHAPVWQPTGGRIAFVAGEGTSARIYVMNPDGSGRQQLVTDEGGEDTDPCWSPDGNYLAFSRSMTADTQIYLCRADGSRATPVTTGSNLKVQPAWSVPLEGPSPYSVTLTPDSSLVMAGGTCMVTATVRDGSYAVLSGQSVTFQTTAGAVAPDDEGGTDGNGQKTATFTAPATAGTARVTATVAGGKNPATAVTLGALGSGKVVFQTNRDTTTEVYTMDPNGSNAVRRTTSGGQYPSWSPDEARIAYTVGTGTSAEIWVMGADGSSPVRLTNNSSADESPVWSPDGSRIAFSSARNGSYEIYVMNADGTDQTRLTRDGAANYTPVWSPDGRKIAFSSNRDSNTDVYVVGADGSGLTRLTNSAGTDDYPAWSPDGRSIAFASTRDGNYEIYVMNSDGGNPTRLLEEVPGADLLPTWSPDGSKIMFCSSRAGSPDLYTMNADGTSQEAVMADAGDDMAPKWSPGLPEGNYSAGVDGAKLVQASQVYSQDYGEGIYDLGAIPADGTSTRNIAFTLRGGHYEPRANESVSFTTDGGTLSATSGTTDAFGKSTVTLTSAASTGQATVTLRADGPRGEVICKARVHFGAGRIAFAGSNSFSVNGLFTVLPDGSDLQHIATNTDVISDPAWSADGTRIAYTDNGNVWVVLHDGSATPVPLTSTGSNTSPSWSPDGSRIVYSHYNGSVTELYTVPSSGGTPTLLASVEATNLSEPQWSPDGTRILYTRYAGAACDLWVMDPDGTNAKPLTSEVGNNQMASWSPDGSKIAFISDRDAGGLGEVYVMDADGSNQTRITTNTSVDYDPCFSADGTQIVYSNSRSGLHRLFVVKADGSQSDGSQLSISGFWDVCTDPAWSRGTDPATGRAAKAGQRTRTQNARLRAYCNGQEAFALLTPSGVVPEGRGDSLITTGDRARGDTRDPGADSGSTAPATGLRFVQLSADEARSAGSTTRAAGTSRSWSFAIEAPTPDAQITLSWPDLSGLGAKERLLLEDLDGGRRRSMRTTAAYTFRISDGTRRRFVVTAEPRMGPAILVTGLQLLGADGGTRTAGNALRLVRFNLSTEASVDIRLVAPTGREVAMLTRQYAATSGQNQLSWRGVLQPGLYLMEATASTEDGTAVKMIQPVVVVR